MRTLLGFLIASTRRFFLLTGPHTSTALRQSLPLSENPALPIPSRTAPLRSSEGHRRFQGNHLRSRATDTPLPQQPTQWKRQFLNFFGCPGSTAPPLPGLSRRVASRRLRKLTTPSARASRSRKPAPRSSSRSLGRSPKSYHVLRGLLLQEADPKSPQEPGAPLCLQSCPWSPRPPRHSERLPGHHRHGSGGLRGPAWMRC